MSLSSGDTRAGGHAPPARNPLRIGICLATVERPHPATVQSLEKEVKEMHARGWEDVFATTIGNPYISYALADMAHRVLTKEPDYIVFLDHDLSWQTGSVCRLVDLQENCAAGLYRFRKDEEEYMGTIHSGNDGRPRVRHDGCIHAEWVPTGFLCVKADAWRVMMRRYPELLFGDPVRPHFDAFNHGAYNWMWYGQDYAFSRRVNECGMSIWVVPDLDITHHDIKSGKEYPGNFHKFLMRQPGGINDPDRMA